LAQGFLWHGSSIHELRPRATVFYRFDPIRHCLDDHGAAVSAGVTMMTAIRKRHELEVACQASIKAWHEQYEITVRLAKAELEVKCKVAMSLRDIQLRELSGEEPEWPGIA